MNISSNPIPGVGLNWRQIIALNLAVSFGVSVIISSFGPEAGLHALAVNFAWCLVFTNLVGLPAAYILSRWGAHTAKRSLPLSLLIVVVEILAFTTVGTILIAFIMQWMTPFGPVNYWGNLWTSLRFSSVVGLSVGLGTYFWLRKKEELEEARREIERHELAEAQARNLAVEAQLSSLESRIHPHFLFNTLNSIAALIPDDPKLAEETVQRLAALLRFSLDAAQERFVPFEQEWKVVQDYLAIEQARFGDRLRYSLELDPGAAAKHVPPLALQTLVENSVKHAVARRREGANIRVSARDVGPDIVMEVSDDGPGFDLADLKSGHGLANLRARLSGLFGDRATLEVRRGGEGGVSVSLRMPGSVTTPGVP